MIAGVFTKKGTLKVRILSSVFRFVTWRCLTDGYIRFGRACLCHPQGSRLTNEDGNESLLRKVKVKVKQFHYRPGQAQRVPWVWGSQISWQTAHEGGKVVSPMHRPPLPPGNIPGTHFCYRLSWPQSHSAARRIMSMENCNETIGNQTHNFLLVAGVPLVPKSRW
jgi:hypothetical protein